ncbi:vanadium-dependent haloperoxidase [Streptomyces iconiensis]|uniref:Vanadium-dependent haloperoxidase n=1 Tax=Streptomyces iconiensis TaxID=1384038 RepID=A0ABT6ZX82_9ACTN|nr:vanadium-dependent haloperoxidase [Streptomyces iconiensis]MDJ1133687.1 vanadium-dependent haloperoxidase [Streptomyces iconiensis]
MKQSDTSLRQGTPRRSMLFGIASGAGALAVGGVGLAAPATAAPGARPREGFDFDTGNAPLEVFGPVSADPVRAEIHPSDATLIIRFSNLMAHAWFDAIAPYHPTAVGIHSELGRRPASEAKTNRNKNIALLYASYRMYSTLLPMYEDVWRTSMESVGMNPDDEREDTRTPVGIGNLAAKNVLKNRMHDGMNQLGDHGGREHNRQPFEDYTGYQPVNTAYKLRNPSRWQPRIATKGGGIFHVQQFVTPQLQHVRPYSYSDPGAFRVPEPRASDHHNRRAYKAQADEVLAASARLTDEQKTKCEMFDNKFVSLGSAVGSAAEGADLDGWVHLHTVADTATFDASIAAWYGKNVYDTVRPFTAIRHLYGDRPVRAWGGPGKGTVRLPASHWQSYLGTPDHPEYPSGSTALCAAEARAVSSFLGTDAIRIRVTRAKGSSVVEPGVTPHEDTVLSWDNWTDWRRDCGLSRFWGGVHFMAAVEESWDMGRKVGDSAFAFVRKHIDGEV